MIEKDRQNEDYHLRACINSGNGEPKIFTGTKEECSQEMVKLVNFIADDRRNTYVVGQSSEGGFW